jgi:hypothetical protein
MKKKSNALEGNSFLGPLTSMKACHKRQTAGFFMGLLFICIAVLAPSVSRASEAAADSWSFRFNDLPVADALKQLSQVTGVRALTNTPPENKRLTRSYENETIEQIIRDILRGVNYTLEWRTSDKGLESVAITFIDEGSGGFRQSSKGSTRYGGVWPVERNSDYEGPQFKPQMRQQKKNFPRRPLARNPEAMPTEAASNGDGEEIEAEDVSESEDVDEELSSISEPVESDGFADGAESKDESTDEVTEDEESPPSDHEEEPEELEQ